MTAEVKVAMEEVAKKLTLWHTRTFQPILTHDDLEPIMLTSGFVPLPVNEAAAAGGGGMAWKEYKYRAATWEMLPRPRLPYPRIDGLHLMAYKAFFLALEFYLGAHLVSDLFHVRTMSLTKAQDRAIDRTYRPMRDCEMEVEEEWLFVYRNGTLDNFTKMFCDKDEEDDSISEKGLKKISHGNSNSPANLMNFIALKDLLPSSDITGLS
ncbi:uncharacterized protein [Elaeis guineensis]|uniref:Uncharacterized protein LOC105053279 n=1 Tax=Elaeis guineensis var. tenera TaxID=51953 RepID=A0A6I9RUA0_ELAGV|nr:uncharacterized protein LOC105053279 [Elaeis guineensis]